MSAIAVSVAKANAGLFSQLVMSPGHKMDSNTDQSDTHGHFGVFFVGNFLRKADVVIIRVLIASRHRRPSRHRARGQGSRRVSKGH